MSQVDHKGICPLSRECLNILIAKYCPLFYLSKGDIYKPCSFEYFIENSTLKWSSKCGKIHKVLLEKGVLTEESLVGACICRQDHYDGEYWLDLEASARQGELEFDSVPVYATVKAILRADESKYEALEITYITLFAYNGPYSILGLLDVGAHDGDIEHITVRVDMETEGLIGVWYNAHRNRDGTWVAGPDVERDDECGRLVSYVAKHGHGHYPKAGRYFRHFFLGNDICSRGASWKPKQVVLLPGNNGPDYSGPDEEFRLPICRSRGSLLEDICFLDIDSIVPPTVEDKLPCKWVMFKGRFGTAPAPCQQSWYYQAEPPVSRHPFLRLFLHFWPEKYQV
eukprot:jgi/Picsp_1/2387/NSC_05849-R1_pre-mrna processing protein prp39 gb